MQKDGLLHVATNAAQERRLHERLPSLRAEGWGEDDLIELDRDQLAERVRVAGARGAQWSPHCARVQPAKLVRGLADVVERMGIAVYEGTEVTEIRPRQAVTVHGTVKATYVIRALEGFTAGLRGHRRVWLPMNSSVIVTEPLPASAWEEIGWRGAELIGDEAHSYCYIQRTTDGRIAIGGRGVPYMFGSHVDQRGETKAPPSSSCGPSSGNTSRPPKASPSTTPLRWLGVRSLYVAYRAADRHENSGLKRTSVIARAANLISGR
ncbi:NAD(P)/FAD-dependent oxidoreductase [Streptomyces sp. GMR22]|uniref:NAD(P)/FAD-dependent oxidoreductase n=1 Tax=Streptomyces sp. GMR22 TaxID=2759524 RepID=UPI003FA36F69